MTRTRIPRRWTFLVALTAALLALPTAPAVEQAPAPSPANPQAREIADLERQIADLQAKLAALKNPPTSKTPAVVPGTIPDAVVKKMTWRPIGPANMGGRVTALAVVESDPTTYFVATASGGLLKTVNNGITFEHQFDREAVVSIGDVAVAPSDPKIVWVGTGENNPRNSVSYGDGVYKSTDGGKTWANVGLRQSFQIGKILIHPKNPDVVYVGALGRLYGANPERGVFKTTDGGKTWNKVLFVDDKTGIIDMRMDPTDPETVVAAAWEHRRDEHDGFFGTPPVPDIYGPVVTHGAGSGLYRTTDGGKTWKKLSDPALKNGLPTAKMGRIGLEYSRKTKGLLFAIIDTEKVGTGVPPPPPGYMGVVGEDVPDKGGAKITEVVADGPAAKAGLKVGDVVTAAAGEKVAAYTELVSIVRAKTAGDVMKLTVRRGGKDETLSLTVGESAKADPAPKKGGPRKGTDPPAPLLGVVFGEDTVRVLRVTDDGPAAKAGISAGDVIAAVAGKKVATQTEYREAVRAVKAGEKTKVAVTRDGKPKEFDVTFAAPGTAPARGPTAAKPYNLGLGGQQPNVQDRQGPDAFQTGGVFVSRDNGTTWARVNSLNVRPMYFSQVRVDPADDNTLYVLGDTALFRSTDGGKTFRPAPIRGVHADHHALWIDPKDSRHMVIGCDGGFYATYDRGDHWDHLNHLALGQFYHVAVDSRKPYRVYGGLQDNGSWGGPSHVLRGGGPVNDDWAFVQGGDGFVCRVDPTDPDLVYTESQNGNMARRNYRTGDRASLKPRPVKPGEDLRFNWNTPFILSSHNPSIFYSAAQYVFRSVKKGEDQKAISPEITRTKQGSATALAESPKSPDVLWAGTDDGFVWVTRDGGTKWENVTEKFKAAGLPGPRWVASIEPSRAKDGRCYVVFDAHRSDDDKPYVFVTEDFGQTWKSITANLPAFGSTRVLREDLTNPDLLYLGTEFGLSASANRGASWAKINNNLPTVAVHEVAQPTTAAEIVVGTHGRSVWVLDVASLRQITADSLKAPATLFAPAAATRWKPEPRRDSPYSASARRFVGTNPVHGAVIDYLLTAPAKDLSLRVTDATGKTVRDVRTAPKDAGFHRVQWDLARTGGNQGAGQLVPAGTYRVVLVADGKELTQPLVVENDPNADPNAVITAGGDTPAAEGEDEEEEEEREREERPGEVKG